MLLFLPGNGMKYLQAGPDLTFWPFFFFFVYYYSVPLCWQGEERGRRRRATFAKTMHQISICLSAAALLPLCPRSGLPGLVRTSSFSEVRSRREGPPGLVRGATTQGPLCSTVRVEAKVHPIGGYCNSCSFAHWPGINSPQGQGAVSGILIGMSGLIFTPLHILLHLLENEERSCHVWQSRNKRKTYTYPLFRPTLTENLQKEEEEVSCLFKGFQIRQTCTFSCKFQILASKLLCRSQIFNHRKSASITRDVCSFGQRSSNTHRTQNKDNSYMTVRTQMKENPREHWRVC